MEFGSVSYPSQTSYRGAIVNRFSPELTVKLIGGRAFQAPSGTLLFAHAGFGNNKNLVGSERLDDPRPLRPQVVTSTELVASSQLGDMASLEGSVYRQVLSDAIRFNQVGAIIVAKNSGSKTTAGAELVLNLHLGWFRPYVAGSVSRQVEAEVTRDLAGITTFDGSPSLYPRWMGHAGFDIELLEALLYANTELFFVGPRGASQANFYDNDSRVYDLPSYNLLDVTLTTGDLPLLDPAHGTRLSFSARNLLNHKYYEPGFAGVDIPQSGTSLFFELRQNL
jgi:outer membrane receptor protein involved in Fe transport